MKKYNILTLLLVITMITSCTDEFKDSVDVTDVFNPNLSENSLVGQPNSSFIWLSGMERELSRTFNEILVLSELGSDNYVNTQTFYNQFFDQLEIRQDDPDIRDTQNEIARLRAMAIFGIESVGPNDPNYSAETEADYHFLLGMSRMFSAMYFSFLPQETLGAAIDSETNYRSAISSFEMAISSFNNPEYHLAKARCHYYLGEQSEAVNAANQALAISTDFIRMATFDELNLPANNFESALYERATFDDLQPLPTLDFLDPKYSFLNATEDPPVNFLKAEEAYLILAEANLADGNIMEAQTNLTDLLTVVGSREVRTVNELEEGRIQVDPGSRPNNVTVVVNGRSGLVLDRTASVAVPSVSGTSLTSDDIANIEDNDAALELLYRTRQEIFIAEGLRFVDMGLKMAINENEILQNPNITETSEGTSPVIPSFIDAVKTQLDAITYDADANTASTDIDVTSILVANKTATEVLPFH